MQNNLLLTESSTDYSVDFGYPALTCYCKLLLGLEEAAETLVSSDLSNIADLEKLTGVTVTISPPSTEEVVVVLAGPIQCIHAAVEFVAERLGCMRDSEFTSLLRRKVVTLRVVVPNSVVGVLMGRSGKDIRNLAVSCGVRIQISQRIAGLLERVVHVTGTVTQVVMAAASVVETIQADPHTHEHARRLLASLAAVSVFNTPEPLVSAPTLYGTTCADYRLFGSGTTSDCGGDRGHGEDLENLQELLNTLANNPDLLANL
jgi:hypothetical protein